ncbi:D-alanyl-D-alanine carboxypeptidase / D-alanyl-D-alanine-endopeptidase (penicillin-binding protein 4) [Robiginitalea myxolifaciens]|uniref:D-alanyl-D-alanine carboxypeptidase / D-alanyl-D-alanine-endopeptidase (Penicillin-binding protein 4) n=1 Tax=Robiginitalea myxolifaciens TaxID=400055 RepID=A0A1I6FMU7_9FLAO|nr:D-alanyl-D-alanine carboxypeptidase [Robiginitalea myxolifaciens]SFR31285.1 D-alanyl-D-alanine carboxypeptidase / D-alanyl-D-alanine-endopeptidase (penicillin-binding protein 4) [Robiginitalea myxolifaciens]
MRQGFARLLFAALGAILLGCSPTKKLVRHLEGQLNAPAFERQFTGVLLLDAETRDTLVAYNASKPFIPASNVKLLTLYTGLNMLPDKLPALKYHQAGDTLYILGTGYPATLEPFFKDSTVLKFLGTAKKVIIENGNLESAAYGPGWAWDDYRSAYMLQRSAMPIYGNVRTLFWENNAVQVVPPELPRKAGPADYAIEQITPANLPRRIPELGDTLYFPISSRPEVERTRWQYATSKYLGRPVFWVSRDQDGEADPGGLATTAYSILPGITADTLYGRMMQTSDNFLAEQIMLMASSTLGDSLSFEKAKTYALEQLLPGLPQEPRWVDGSGLSRYNLISPAALVYLLDRMYQEIPRERLFGLLASGKAQGTLDGMYLEDDAPFVYAKTGTLSNNHNLSGYLLTRSGKTVIFSFMNNHYQEPTSVVKARMAGWLREVYERY